MRDKIVACCSASELRGYGAWLANEPITSCPYPECTPEWEEWIDGWRAAERDYLDSGN